jgi:hypothetical protein
MTKLALLWLAGCALCVTPVAAAEDVYDGPTAIRPLTVTPKAPHSQADPVCDFEHQCYPKKGGPNVSTAVAPQIPAAKRAPPSIDKRPHPVVVAKRAEPRAQAHVVAPRRDYYASVDHCGCHGLMADGTSVAAGGLLGVMPTATARRWSV